jgi:hypothetical protein
LNDFAKSIGRAGLAALFWPRHEPEMSQARPLICTRRRFAGQF